MALAGGQLSWGETRHSPERRKKPPFSREGWSPLRVKKIIERDERIGPDTKHPTGPAGEQVTHGQVRGEKITSLQNSCPKRGGISKGLRLQKLIIRSLGARCPISVPEWGLVSLGEVF